MNKRYEQGDTSQICQCEDCGVVECTAIQMFYGVASPVAEDIARAI